MTKLIYEPGEVDEGAYCPASEQKPLPKWRPSLGLKAEQEAELKAEQKAFLEWCLATLDEKASEEQLEQVMCELQSDETAIELLQDLKDQSLFERARELMPLLTRDAFRRYRYGSHETHGTDPDRKGRKGDQKIAAARIDNARLTLIFKSHFNGKYRRPENPSRLTILGARHGLNDDQIKTLDNYLYKAK